MRVILAGQAADLEALRLEIWPRVQARLDATERQVGAVLSPKQREKWRLLSTRLRRDWLGG